MGYYIEQIYDDFTIRKDNIKKAWDALKKLMSKRPDEEYHYSWIHSPTVIQAKTFEDAMSESRFDVQYDKEGNVCGITFNGEKLGDEEIILRSIAPYVEDGSYIIFQGEAGERWKWKFINKTLEGVEGRWVFDDEE